MKLKFSNKDFETIGDEIVQSRVNCGFPVIVLQDGDYMKAGELYLKHIYEGIGLDVGRLEKVLEYLYQLWGRAVHVETVLEDHLTQFTYQLQ